MKSIRASWAIVAFALGVVGCPLHAHPLQAEFIEISGSWTVSTSVVSFRPPGHSEPPCSESYEDHISYAATERSRESSINRGSCYRAYVNGRGFSRVRAFENWGPSYGVVYPIFWNQISVSGSPPIGGSTNLIVTNIDGRSVARQRLRDWAEVSLSVSAQIDIDGTGFVRLTGPLDSPPGTPTIDIRMSGTGSRAYSGLILWPGVYQLELVGETSRQLNVGPFEASFDSSVWITQFSALAPPVSGSQVVDVDADGDADEDDLGAWILSPRDLNGDGQANQADRDWLEHWLSDRGWVISDCNANGLPDVWEAANIPSSDTDGDGFIDTCAEQVGTIILPTERFIPQAGSGFDPNSSDRFGARIDMRGGSLAVAAPHAQRVSADPTLRVNGAVYVFCRSEQSVFSECTLPIRDAAASLAGAGVNIEADRLLTLSFAGPIVYRRENNEWVFEQNVGELLPIGSIYGAGLFQGAVYALRQEWMFSGFSMMLHMFLPLSGGYVPFSPQYVASYAYLFSGDSVIVDASRLVVSHFSAAGPSIGGSGVSVFADRHGQAQQGQSLNMSIPPESSIDPATGPYDIAAFSASDGDVVITCARSYDWTNPVWSLRLAEHSSVGEFVTRFRTQLPGQPSALRRIGDRFFVSYHWWNRVVVYKLDRRSGRLEIESVLVPPSNVPISEFGHALASDGDTLAIGAPGGGYLPSGEQFGGSVFLYRVPPNAPCPGDADGNAFVNFADVASVLRAWGQTGPAGMLTGDADVDGVVDFTDITAILRNFGRSCEP